MHRLRTTPFDYAKLLAPSGGAFDEQREAAPSCVDHAPEAPNTRFLTTPRPGSGSAAFLGNAVDRRRLGAHPKYASWSPTSAPSWPALAGQYRLGLWSCTGRRKHRKSYTRPPRHELSGCSRAWAGSRDTSNLAILMSPLEQFALLNGCSAVFGVSCFRE
jgi:hypothetical protein